MSLKLCRRCPSFKPLHVRCVFTTNINGTPSETLSNAKTINQLPTPRTFPIIGTAWQYLPFVGSYKLNKLHVNRWKRRDTYGNIVLENFWGKKVVFLHDADDIAAMFRNEGKYPDRVIMMALKKYREERPDFFKTVGLFGTRGEEWHDLRFKVQQYLLNPKNINQYVPIMEEVSQDFVERIRLIQDPNTKQVPADFLNEIYKWALESLGVVALDSRIQCLSPDLPPESEPQQMIQALNAIFQGINQTEFGSTLWKYYPTKAYRSLATAHQLVERVTTKYINRAMDKMKGDSEVGDSVLEKLLSKKDLGIENVRVVLLDMFMAGVDTTSHTWSMLLYYLAKHQDVQEKLYREICDKIGPRPADPVTLTSLTYMTYLKACLKESMRLSPIVDATVRILPQDITLSGYRIPAKVILTPISRITSQTEKYFPRPLEFLPERWLKPKAGESNPVQNHIHPFASLPFGYGPRMCVGRRIAEQEMYILTIKILQSFRVEFHHGDLDIYTRFINVPDKPLQFTFVNRD